MTAPTCQQIIESLQTQFLVDLFQLFNMNLWSNFLKSLQFTISEHNKGSVNNLISRYIGNSDHLVPACKDIAAKYNGIDYLVPYFILGIATTAFSSSAKEFVSFCDKQI